MKPQIFPRSSFPESLRKLNMNYSENIIIHSGKPFAESHALHSVMEISKALGPACRSNSFILLLSSSLNIQAKSSGL